MKKRTQLWLILALVVFGQVTVIGQTSKITLLHNGNSTFFNNMTPALAAAVNGDTIYLPGGPISASSPIVIDKLLTIVGAGHYPDSTVATYQTLLQNITFCPGGDGSTICGINCNYLEFGSRWGCSGVNNITIKQCFIGNLYSGWPGHESGTLLPIIFSENVIAGLTGDCGFSQVQFFNNIFKTGVTYNYPAAFLNNIFYTPGSDPSGGYTTYYFPGNASEFINNIFIVTAYSNLLFGATNCIFNNTLLCSLNSNLISINWGSNITNNVLTTEMTDSTFIDATTPNFSYSNNYHLKPTSNGHNAGTDGTDVGIYGTQFPAKDGAVPFNPHISFKNIGTSVSPTGTLGVDVKVSAQDR